MRRAVLASGGMDSFLIWALFARDAVNVFVDIDHAYAKKELSSLKQLSEIVPDFNVLITAGPSMGKLETPSGIIPMRNAELILAASHHADTILMGVLKDEINSDKSEHFMHLMERVLNESWKKQYWTEGREFSILTPAREYTKTELIRMYIDRGEMPLHWLAATVSCYNKAQEHCGACPSCAKRWMALRANKIEDLNSWATDPINYIMGASGIYEKAMNGTYATGRALEIKQALKGHPRCASI